MGPSTLRGWAGGADGPGPIGIPFLSLKSIHGSDGASPPDAGLPRPDWAEGRGPATMAWVETDARGGMSSAMRGLPLNSNKPAGGSCSVDMIQERGPTAFTGFSTQLTCDAQAFKVE